MKRLGSLLAALALAMSASAHRLDELLQATRVELEPGRIELHLDLTPGVAVARDVLRTIDPDGDGRISQKEQRAYSRRVLEDLHLQLDGEPVTLQPGATTFPSASDMQAGEGTIRLRGTAIFPKLKSGPHELLLRNDHLPQWSVYLVNALAPKNRSILITRQVRDETQREYRLSFELNPTPAQTAAQSGR